MGKIVKERNRKSGGETTPPHFSSVKHKTSEDFFQYFQWKNWEIWGSTGEKNPRKFSLFQ